MKQSYKKEFTYLTLRKAIRERDTEHGNVVIIINSDTKEKIYHEIITGLCESDTVLSYCDTTGSILTILLGQSDTASKKYSYAVEAIQDFKESKFMNLFNIQHIILSYTVDIGETLFRSMTNTREKDGDAHC